MPAGRQRSIELQTQFQHLHPCNDCNDTMLIINPYAFPRGSPVGWALPITILSYNAAMLHSLNASFRRFCVENNSVFISTAINNRN